MQINIPFQTKEKPINMLRSLLSEIPSKGTFLRLMRALQHWKNSSEFSLLLGYTREHLETWPDVMRAWTKWEPKHPGWILVRHLDLVPESWYERDTFICPEIKTAQHITSLRIMYRNEETSECSLQKLVTSPLVNTIKRLSLDFGPNTRQVSNALYSFKELTYLQLKGASWRKTSSFSLDSLKVLKNIQTLHFEDMNLLKPTFAALPRLKEVKLLNCTLSTSLLDSIPEKANLYISTSSSEDLTLLYQRPQLKGLECTIEYMEEDIPLNGLDSLDSLTFHFDSESQEPLELFEQTQLRVLRLPALEESQECWPEPPCDLRRFDVFTNIRELDLTRRAVEHLDALSALTTLETLWIQGIEVHGLHNKSPSFDFLQSLQQLTALSISTVDKDFAFLKHFPKLRILRSEGPDYGDGEILEDDTLQDLSILSELHELEALYLADKTSLEVLDVSNCSSLRILSLRSCPSLKKIIGLTACPKLESVWIEECDLLRKDFMSNIER